MTFIFCFRFVLMHLPGKVTYREIGKLTVPESGLSEKKFLNKIFIKFFQLSSNPQCLEEVLKAFSIILYAYSSIVCICLFEHFTDLFEHFSSVVEHCIMHMLIRTLFSCYFTTKIHKNVLLFFFLIK